MTPTGIDRVVQTCLEKDPEKRWQSAREVKHALTWISAETPSARSVAKPVRLWQGLAALMALIAFGIAGWMFGRRRPASSSTFEALLPENVTPGDSIAISPDGRKLVIGRAKRTLDSRASTRLEWRHLPGTEGALSPFWSPDSRYLAFAATNQLKKIDIAGGPPETLLHGATDVRGRPAPGIGTASSCSGAGEAVPAARYGRSRSGGAATAVTEVDTSKGELYHTWPTFLPDGKHFLYFRSGPPEIEGSMPALSMPNPEEQSRERILASPFPVAYANGYLFF